MAVKFIIAILALVVGLFVGGKFFARSSPGIVAPPTTPLPASVNRSSTFCTAPPTKTEIGADSYPVDPKYGRLGFLGELFTAADCGPERVQKIFGVEGDFYTIGSMVSLKAGVPAPLAQALERAGFSCKDKKSRTECRTWILPDRAPLADLLTLREAAVRFAENIERDDCVNCG